MIFRVLNLMSFYALVESRQRDVSELQFDRYKLKFYKFITGAVILKKVNCRLFSPTFELLGSR